MRRRDKFGPHFSEGARLCWLALASRGWNQERLRLKTRAHKGELSRVLFRDRRPSLLLAERIQRVLGIPMPAWASKPTVEFAPPPRSAAAAEAAAAAPAASPEAS
jgi:transcriptional regulator with XRE-family HTH domain